MKTLTIFVSLSLFAISNAEVVQNPNLSQATWDPEKITRVDVVLRRPMRRRSANGGGDGYRHSNSGGNDPTIYSGAQLNVNIVGIAGNTPNYNHHCNFVITFAGSSRTIASTSGQQLGQCSLLRINRSSNPQVQVSSSAPDAIFNLFDVMITTEHSAQFQALFPNQWHQGQTHWQSASVFFPSSTVQINSQVQCSGLNSGTGQIDSDTLANSCATDRMRVNGINGRHNYLCSPGCARVKNLNIDEQGNGYRCFESTTLQENSQYCCMDGQRGGVPGCEDQVAQPTNNTPSRNDGTVNNTPNYQADQAGQVQGVTCPVHDPNYFTIRGKCFYLENTAKTHLQAKTNCRNKFQGQGKLFEPRDSQSHWDVLGKIEEKGIPAARYWIGIKMQGANWNRNYFSFLTGQQYVSADDARWGSSQPDNYFQRRVSYDRQPESCVEVSLRPEEQAIYKKWNDALCNRRKKSICEM